MFLKKSTIERVSIQNDVSTNYWTFYNYYNTKCETKTNSLQHQFKPLAKQYTLQPNLTARYDSRSLHITEHANEKQ
jgi:hypothetical protein